MTEAGTDTGAQGASPAVPQPDSQPDLQADPQARSHVELQVELQADAASAGDEGTSAFLGTAALLGGFTLLSRILGLARDMSMAWLLGNGPAADALAAAMRLPHALRRLLAEGSLSMTLTADLVRNNNAGPAELLIRFATARLAVVLILLTAIGIAAAPWISTLLTPGFGAAQRTASAELLRICLFYVPFAGLAALGMAVLHSRGQFRLPALAPVLFNFVVLLFAGGAALGLGAPAEMLAWGLVAGGLAQWLLQRQALQHCPASVQISADAAAAQQAKKAAWARLRRLPVGVLGAAAPQLAMLAALIPASLLGEGRVSALYYAERLLELPLGLIGVCLGMAGLPLLSRLAAQGDFTSFAARFGEAQRLGLMLSLPAAAGLWAVGPELVDVLLRRGAFDMRAAQETTLALWAYLPGLPAFACIRIRLAACNALHEIRRPAWATFWAVLVTIAAGHILLLALPAAAAGAGPAAAVSLGLCCQSLLLGRSMRQRLREVVPQLSTVEACPGLWTKALLRHAAAAGVTAVAARCTLDALCGASNPVLWPFAPLALWPQWAGLGAAVAMGTAAWLVCLCLLRDPDVCAALGRLRRGKMPPVR